ncbi:targeting protein for XKLP2 [Artemisia annua]|uniref:Targeting protein for XKLP2 n=1 Tax=Artemisia annua TaxID=35608 RepID=A0A2U1NXT1_ARTAN|nr:targeting protein for XKLP2 [Artemisia annua]
MAIPNSVNGLRKGGTVGEPFQGVQEDKALKQLRRNLVPHARTCSKFQKAFLTLKGVTKPRSITLKIIERTERRKMVVAAAMPSATSNMR